MLDIRRTLEPAANTSGVHLQVAGSDVVPLNKRPLFVDDLVNAQVGMEVGLDVLEECDGTVSSSSSEALFNTLCVFNDTATYPVEPIPIASWKVMRRAS